MEVENNLDSNNGINLVDLPVVNTPKKRSTTSSTTTTPTKPAENNSKAYGSHLHHSYYLQLDADIRGCTKIEKIFKEDQLLIQIMTHQLYMFHHHS